MARLTIARGGNVVRARTRCLVVIALCAINTLLVSIAAAQQRDPVYSFNSEPTAIPGITPKKKAWYSKVGDSMSNGWKATTGVFKRSDKKPAKKIDKNDAVHLGGNQSLASADLHVGMSQMFLEQGRIDLAVKHLDQAFKLEPNNLKAIRGYARLLQQQGKIAEAEKQIRRAVQIDPKSPGVWNDLAMCLAQQGKRAEAAQALEQAIQLRPRKSLYRNNAAAVLVEMGETERAMQHLTSAHGVPKAHYNLGILLAKTGKRQEASAHFQRALQLDGSLVAAREWLAQLHGRPQSPERVAQRPLDVRRPQAAPMIRQTPAVQPQIVRPATRGPSAGDQFWSQPTTTPSTQSPKSQWQTGTYPSPVPAAQPRGIAAQPARVAPTPTPRPASPATNARSAEDSFWSRPAQQPTAQTPQRGNFGTNPAFARPQPRVADQRMFAPQPTRPAPQPTTTAPPVPAPPVSAATRTLPSQQFQPYKPGPAPTPGPPPRYVSDPRYAPQPSQRYKSPLKFGKQAKPYTAPQSQPYR